MRSVLENVPCALEKNVYFAVFGCIVLQISIKANWPIVSFKTTVAEFLLKDQLLTLWGFPCMLFVVFPLLLLIFFLCI